MTQLIEFRISRRHYDTIIQQAITNYPQESGGFLGGKDYLIQGILPAFNQHQHNKTDTFAVTQDDILRGHEFFDKHKLDYYGVYHTHPNGIAYPSDQDVSTGQKYHFIVGLMDLKNPDFQAFHIVNRQIFPVPLIVVSDQFFSVKDIFGSKNQPTLPDANATSKDAPLKRDPESEAALLSNLIDNIRHDKKNYPKFSPLNDQSDFSTLA